MVSAFRATVRVDMVGAIELRDAVEDVRGGVRVDTVHYHVDSVGVGSVHKVFEVIRGALPGGHREEVSHVVTERGVVGVLLDSHELDAVVAAFFDSGDHVVGKLTVGRYFSLP